MENKKEIIEVFVGLIIIYAVYKMFKKIGQSLNLVADEKDEAAASLVEDKGNIFSPNYWKGKKGAKILTTNVARDMSKRIYNAAGTFNDNEEAVYGVFRQLTYKTQLSWLSYMFYKQYGEDLLQYITNFMNADELATVKQITSKLK